MNRSGNTRRTASTVVALIAAAYSMPASADRIEVLAGELRALIEFSIEETVEIGSTGWASLTIEVDSDPANPFIRELTEGDTVLIELLESDGPAGNELLFSTLLTVTADEVLQGQLRRSLDTTFDPIPFLPDGQINPNTLDIFSRAIVDKAACNFFCNNPRPQTEIVSVTFFDPLSVPEPGTLTLLGIGLFGMGLARRRKA